MENNEKTVQERLQINLCQEGRIFYIMNGRGEYWLGAPSCRWQAPRENGAEVPCWMTTHRLDAEGQHALLVAQAWRDMPMPAEFTPVQIGGAR